MQLRPKFQLLGLLLIPFFGISQNSVQPPSDVAIDSLYREDQIYFGFTYNLLVNSPTGTRSSGLSGGVQGGFVRDMPINKRRNIAIASGLGIAYDQFGSNFFVGKDLSGETIFRVLDDNVDYDQNRFGMAMIEVPIEFRWRTSTPTEYRFWRFYAGARLGYAYWYKATFKQPGNKVYQTKIPEFQPFRMTATLGFGYSTFNFFVAYNLNPLFKNAQTIDGQTVDFRALKFGLIFFVL